MRKILFILVLVLGIGGVSVAQTAQTQPSKEYVAALKKMIVVSGSDATFKLEFVLSERHLHLLYPKQEQG